MISIYNDKEPAPGPRNMSYIVGKRIKMQGFIVSDFAAQRDDFLRDMGGWVASGEVKYREDVVEGIDNTVPAFIGLLQGRNFGKLLIRP